MFRQLGRFGSGSGHYNGAVSSRLPRLSRSVMFDRFNRRGSSSLCLLLLGLFFVLSSTRCFGQLSESKRTRLLAMISTAKENVGRRPFPSVEQSEQRVAQAASELQAYLSRRTSAERAANWIDYVDADQVLKAIESDASEIATNNAARALQGRLIGNVVGLEMPPMVKLREETERLLASLRYVESEKSERLVQQQLSVLAKQLETGDLSKSPKDAADLSFVVQVLDQSNQAPELVAELYNTFSRPNVVFTVSGHLIQDAITRPVDRTRPVRDCILGTRIIGNGRLQGQVMGRLAPSLGRIQVDLVLTGQFRSDSVGYNGPVRLPSIGQGAVLATRSLWIGESGVSLSQVTASTSLNTTITSIQHPLRIVRRIASKQIAKKKSQADQIARERFRNQVVTDFTNQTSEAAQRIGSGTNGTSAFSGNSPRLAEAQVTLKRLNLSPPTRLIGSTSDSVFVQATQRQGKQLAAITSPPPAFGSAIYDIHGRAISRGDASLQIHESLIDNLASTVLGGRTMTGDQIDRLLGNVQTASKTSTTTKAEDDVLPEKFEIEFSTVRPIIFEAREQQIRVGIRGTRFSQGSNNLRRALEITASYEPVDMGGYKVLKRTGVVGVDFPGSASMAQIALRKKIQQVFKDRFPETLLDQPLILPLATAVPTLSGRVFRPRGIDAQDGWLTLTIR